MCPPPFNAFHDCWIQMTRSSFKRADRFRPRFRAFYFCLFCNPHLCAHGDSVCTLVPHSSDTLILNAMTVIPADSIRVEEG